MAGIAVAEVAKKIGSRKKTVRVRAHGYRMQGIPLKRFEPVELPDWDELAEYAASLAPQEQTDASDDDEDVQESSKVEGEETEPAACDVEVDEAKSIRLAHEPNSEVPSEKTASLEAE